MVVCMKSDKIFKPHWPKDLKPVTFYKVACDDKGGDGTCWLKVMVANDGDVHVSMFEQEVDEDPIPLPSIRVRTFSGGGRNQRTRQALLWLAEAIRLDNNENGVKD